MRLRLSIVVLVLIPLVCQAAPLPELLSGGYFVPACNEPSTPPEGKPTAVRGKSDLLLYALKGAPVKVKLTCAQLGKYTSPLEFSITPAGGGQPLATGKLQPAETKEVAFSAPDAGVYRLVCDAGQNASEVEAVNARLAMPASEGHPLAVADHVRRLWFYVPTESEGFKVRISGEGKSESVAVKVFLPDGQEAASGSTVGKTEPVVVEVPVKPGQDNQVWSLQLGKAAEGIFEDAQLALFGGVGPNVAEKPSDLLVPLVDMDLPTLYRRASRTPPILWCSLLAPDLLLRRPTIFLDMVNPATGDVIYSQMLFRFEGGRTNRVRLPQDKASRGDFLVRIKLRESEQEIYTLERRVRVISPPANLREDNVMLADGEPFFARGLYHVQCKDYDLVKNQGFNIVQAEPDQVADCERAGLKAAVALYAGMKMDPNYYREQITKLKGNPAVVCWMIMDEPCGNRVPVEATEDAYRLIRELDPDHAAYMCVCPCRPTVYKEHGHTTDLLGIDVYPVADRPLTDIAEKLEWAKKDAPDRAVWFIGQVWSWPGKEDKTKRVLVTPAQHRCMTYLALTHDDVRGLMWYSLRDADWYLPDSNPPLWAQCKQVNEELETLEPVLIETNKWERVVKGDGEIHLCLKPHEEKLYVIAVNPTDKKMVLSLDLAGEGPGPEASVLFENRTIKLAGAILSDSFEPLAVHIYEIGKVTP